jgi:hypothetical protein
MRRRDYLAQRLIGFHAARVRVPGEVTHRPVCRWPGVASCLKIHRFG